MEQQSKAETKTETKTKLAGLNIDWTVNIGTIGTLFVLCVGWAVQNANLTSRVTTVELQNVAQAVANEKLAGTVQRLDGTLTRLMTQVEERQRQADLRMDRGDFRQDRAELSRQK